MALPREAQGRVAPVPLAFSIHHLGAPGPSLLGTGEGRMDQVARSAGCPILRFVLAKGGNPSPFVPRAEGRWPHRRCWSG